MIFFIDLKRKYSFYKKEIDETLKKTLKRSWFVLGPEVEKFEKNFAKYLGIKYVVGVNSGTDAIFLGLKALEINQGDEVITVANTATPTVAAVRMAGAMPVFVDIDERTFNIDVSLIKEKITKKTKAILIVHLYGYPANMGAVLKIVKKYNLKVIEDACQAHGAEYKNKMVGTIGDVGCFSFYPTKNLGAFGDAGAVVTNNKKIMETVKVLRNYGETSKFNSGIEGVNSRLDEIQAGVLNWGLRKLDFWNKRREELAKIYLQSLKNSPLGLPLTSDEEYKRVWHLFVIKTKHRDELRKFLARNKIQTMIHYPQPIFEQKAYKFLGYRVKDLPITKKVSQEILSLPIYPELEKEEIKKIIKTINEYKK